MPSPLLTHLLASNPDTFRPNRLPSLYSDFSLQRRTNPDGYASNITAWQTALSRAALAGHLRAANAGDALVLKTSDKLASELESAEFGRPVALQCVIDEAARSNAFVPLGYFLSATSSPFARSWLPALSLALPRPPSLGQVLGWGVRTLKGAIIGHSDEYGSLNEGEYVIVENLKTIAHQITTTLNTATSTSPDRIFSKSLFAAQCASLTSTPLSHAAIDVLLTYLSRDVHAIAYDGETLKFLHPSDESQSLSHEDTTIASLKTTINDLTTRIDALDAHTATLTTQIKSALASKNRASAASALKKRKLAEKQLEERTKTLVALEEVYGRIQSARDQVAVVGVMKESARVLKGLNERVGGVESVEEVVGEVRGEMEVAEEVGQVMGEGREEVDEEEIDEELEAMLEAEREKEKEESDVVAEDETQKKLAALEAWESEARRKKGAEKEAEEELENSLGKLSIQDEEGQRQAELQR